MPGRGIKLVAQTKYIVENVRAFFEKEKSKGYMNKRLRQLAYFKGV